MTKFLNDQQRRDRISLLEHAYGLSPDEAGITVHVMETVNDYKNFAGVIHALRNIFSGTEMDQLAEQTCSKLQSWADRRN